MTTITFNEDEIFMLDTIIGEEIYGLKSIIRNNNLKEVGKEALERRIKERVDLLTKIIGEKNNRFAV